MSLRRDEGDSEFFAQLVGMQSNPPRLGDVHRDGYADAWVGDPDWSGELLCSDDQRIHRGAAGTVDPRPSQIVTPPDDTCRAYGPTLP